MVDVAFSMTPAEIGLRVPGTFSAGQTVTVTWTGVHVNSPCGPYGYALDLQTNTLDNPPEMRLSLSQTTGTFVMELSAPATEIQLSAFTSSRCSGGTLFGVQVSVTGIAGQCQYGTEKLPTAPSTLTLTPENIAQSLANLGLGFLGQLMVQFWFSAVDLVGLCDQPPPPFPSIDDRTPAASSATIFQALMSVLWSQNCRCKPGTPSPNPYPIPGAPQPPGWPTAPVFGCDNVDPCSAIQQLLQMVASLQDATRESLNLTTLLQRYSLPMATIRGAAHSGLTGSGSFAISRLLGVDLQLVAVPDGKPILAGNPPYLMNLGWCSVQDDDGLIEEKRFTRSQMTWFPRLMPLSTTFGYALQDGVTMRVVELQAEP